MTTQITKTEQDNLKENPVRLINKPINNLKIRKLKNRDMIMMTGRKGYIKASYDELDVCFDNPRYFDLDGYKTRAEWVLMIGNEFISIYDYKENIPVEEVTCWHVGGTKNALEN